MTAKMTRIALAVGLALLLALGAVGCATTSQEAKARRLNSDEAEKLLGYQRARQGNPEAEADPEANPQALEARGDSLALSGSWEAAMFQYNRALTLANPEQRLRLLGKAAQIHLQARDFPQAENLFETILKDDPGNAQAWQGLGLARLSLNKPQAAADALVHALAIRPDFWKSANALGIIQNQRGEPQKALALFSQALSAAPNTAEIYNNRGLAYLLSYQRALAEADFNRALSINPDFELAHNNLALLMAKEGRFGEAFTAFRRGTGQAQAHNNLGCLLAWRGDDQKAAEHFGQALKDMPRYYPLAGSHLEQIKAEDGGEWLSRSSGGLPILRPQAISRADDRMKVALEPPAAPKVERTPRTLAAAAPKVAPKAAPKAAPAARVASAAPTRTTGDDSKAAPVAKKAEPKQATTGAPELERAVPEKPEPRVIEGTVLRGAEKPAAKAVAPASTQPEVSEPPAATLAKAPAMVQDMGFSTGPVISKRRSAHVPAAEEPLVRLKAKPDGNAGVWRGTIPPQALERDLSQVAWDNARPALP